MWYKGKEVGLKEYVEDRKKEYYNTHKQTMNNLNLPETCGTDYWEDEGFPYAIMDYSSSVPYEDWSKADKKYCLENGWGSRDIKELLKQD